jgi:hypothetical protein
MKWSIGQVVHTVAFLQVAQDGWHGRQTGPVAPEHEDAAPEEKDPGLQDRSEQFLQVVRPASFWKNGLLQGVQTSGLDELARTVPGAQL